MTIYYVDSDATLAGIVTVAGDTVLFKTNTTFNASAVPASLLQKDNITIAEYGTGAKPIISGAVTHLGNEFTQDAPNGVWYLDFAHINYGNIIEDGVALSFINWTTNITTTAALMSVGDYAIDQANQRIYIKTSGNNPIGKTYVTSEAKRGLANTTVTASGLVIKNLAITHISDTGVYLLYNSDFLIDNVDMDMIGGMWQSVFFAGNGITIGAECYNGTVSNCTINRIFDAALSAQNFTANSNLSDINFLTNTVSDCGYSALELSIPSSLSNMKLKNIFADGLNATNIGVNSWGRKSSGIGIIFTVTAPIESSKTMTNCEFKNITVTNALGLIRTGYNYGINKFVDIYGSNITTLLTDYGVVPNTEEKRLYYNVRDNLGNTPSGTAGWQLTPGLALPTRTILSR